jgi:hypothetical protein
LACDGSADGFTKQFPIASCDFKTSGGNAFFKLAANRQLYGEGHRLPDSWLAGRHGARPGILMPDRAFLLGSRYYQEFADNAKDRAEHTAMGLEIEVPAGVFHGCVEVTETSPLEPGEEAPKNYCPGTGFVRDDDGLELVAVYENAESPSAKRQK